MDYKKEALLSTLNQGIEYFESTEQYERCAKLLKIKIFKKDIEKDLDVENPLRNLETQVLEK